jgi:hypothetical protein
MVKKTVAANDYNLPMTGKKAVAPLKKKVKVPAFKTIHLGISKEDGVYVDVVDLNGIKYYDYHLTLLVPNKKARSPVNLGTITLPE